MFDSNYSYKGGNISHSVKINACSGGIYKTYPESWFEYFHVDSKLAEMLFRKEKCYYEPIFNKYSTNKYELEEHLSDSSKEKICEVVILQMIICGDEKVLAEIITKNDFEKNLKLEIKEDQYENKTSNNI